MDVNSSMAVISFDLNALEDGGIAAGAKRGGCRVD